MSQIDAGQAVSSLSPLRHLVKRVLGMMALWTLFGLIVGSTSLGGNIIGILSGAIAGAIVLPWLGMFLGLLGGPAKDSLVGGLTGALVAVIYSSLRAGAIDSYTVNICLIIGGIMGANFAGLLAFRKRMRAHRLA
jgi:hypothetical protein